MFLILRSPCPPIYLTAYAYSLPEYSIIELFVFQYTDLLELL